MRRERHLRDGSTTRYWLITHPEFMAEYEELYDLWWDGSRRCVKDGAAQDKFILRCHDRNTAWRSVMSAIRLKRNLIEAGVGWPSPADRDHIESVRKCRKMIGP